VKNHIPYNVKEGTEKGYEYITVCLTQQTRNPFW